MTAGAFPKSWQETAFVSIMAKGGTAYEFMAITESIDLPQGDYPGESINTVVGGRIWKQSPEEDGEITLELYPTSVGVGDNKGMFAYFGGTDDDAGGYDDGEPLSTMTTYIASAFTARRQRTRFLVAILWTNDPLQSSAITQGATGTSAKVALRFYVKEARIVSHKTSFTDGIVKTTVTFKYPAMNKAGTTKSWAWESSNDMLTSGTAELPTLTYA